MLTCISTSKMQVGEKVQVGSTIEITAYQLSQELNANYRTVSRKLEALLADDLIKIIGQSDNSHRANIYQLSQYIYDKVASEVQESKSKSTSACNSPKSKEIALVNDLQVQVQEQVKTIESLNSLISAREKEIQTLTNSNVQLSADLKIAKSEQKYLEDKKVASEAENARLNQELNKLNTKLNLADKQVQKRNIWLFALSTILLVLVVIVICYFIMAK